MTHINLDAVDTDGAIREAAEEVAGDTRLAFLRKGAVAGGAALGGGAILSALIPGTALAASGRPPAAFGKGDIGILNYALTLEYLESAFYNEATRAGKVTDHALKAFLKGVTTDENAHVKLLKSALGSKAVKRAEVRLHGDPPRPGQVRCHLVRAGEHRRSRLSRSGREHQGCQGAAHRGAASSPSRRATRAPSACSWARRSPPTGRSTTVSARRRSCRPSSRPASSRAEQRNRGRSVIWAGSAEDPAQFGRSGASDRRHPAGSVYEFAYGAFSALMQRRRPVVPLLRQLRGDPLGLGRAARSRRSECLAPRTRTADRVVQSVCPYCAVGCGQRVYVKDEKVDPDRGRPGFADLPRPAVPQGLGVRAAGQLPDARDARSSTVGPAARDVGGAVARAGHRDDRRAADPDQGGDLGGADRQRQAAQAHARDSLPGRARRWTARRTT